MCCNSSCGKGGCRCTCSKIANILVIVGGLNWGLVGLGMLLDSMNSWNVVGMIFGSMPMVEGIVYLLVGIAAVMSIFGCKCKKCSGGCCKDGVCGVDGKVDANMPPKTQ